MKFDVSIEELRKNSLFIGLPMYGGMCSGETAKSLIELSRIFQSYEIPLTFYYLFNESLIPRARNYIADEFMRSEFTHFMFIDSDIGFVADDIFTMFCMSVKRHENTDVIAGIYPRKGIAWEKVRQAVLQGKGADNPYELEDYAADYVFNFAPDQKEINIAEPFNVMEAGTGFLMIPRYVFEGFMMRYPSLTYLPDHVRTEHFDGSREIYLFFDTVVDPKTRRYLSEDYYFCQYVRAIGYDITVCPWFKLKHIGSYTFKGDIAKIAQLGASLTATMAESPNEIKRRTNTKNKKITIKRS